MKTCSKCHETKELTEFHVNRFESDGYHRQCKMCRQVRADLMQEILAAIGETPVTSKDIAIQLGVDTRSARIRMAVLQEQRKIVWVGMTPGSKTVKRSKLYVLANTEAALTEEERLCRASNEWLRAA